MIIKVCGMRYSENIREIEKTGIEWMGFIFYPKSPRFIDRPPCYMPAKCKRVGVFVNENLENILGKVEEFNLDIIQLHGKETPDECLLLKSNKQSVIKAFSIDCENDLKEVSLYENCCDYFLFDTKCPAHGGSGLKFNWDILQHYSGRTPFLLSGGISPESINDIKKFHHEKWIGIDINSGFEKAPALKDKTAIQSFIKQIKS